MRPEFKGLLHGTKVSEEQFEDIIDRKHKGLLILHIVKTNDEEYEFMGKIVFYDNSKEEFDAMRKAESELNVQLYVRIDRLNILEETSEGLLVKYNDFTSRVI
jgi:hypothetical protein